MSEYIVDLASAVTKTREELTATEAILALSGLPVLERITRCKDCKYYEDGYSDGATFDATVCWGWENGHDYPCFTIPDGFCHRAERRDGSSTTPYIRCKSCGMRTRSSRDYEKLKKIWNRRA